MKAWLDDDVVAVPSSPGKRWDLFAMMTKSF